jgi:predicted dehydrogenase/NADPH:quinone reductase-like Zn-dependent oxidoreductase
LLRKAQSRPDLVKEALNKVKRDGLLTTISAIRSRLDEPSTLGYSNAGTVVEVGVGIDDLAPGDRVACAGAGFAVHAEFACVPRMLVARIPSERVDFASAAFTTVGTVALHGIRIAEAKIGEVVAVIGLGLLGQLAVQILNAAGCAVIGFDPAQERAQLALQMGARAAAANESDFRDLCCRYSGGHGADSIMITAATSSNGPVTLAAEVARDRAIVVAVGDVGMELQRRRYYEKELDFRVSRSYGPGRYDVDYEQKGRDYPIGQVRWTETRNMEAFLRLLDVGKVELKPLITHCFSIEEADRAYELITGKTAEPHLGVVLQYASEERDENVRLELVGRRTAGAPKEEVRVGVLGAGNFARGVLIPAMRKSNGSHLAGVCASNGVRAHAIAKKFGFEYCTTNEEEIFCDASINTVVIATRHHLHSAQVIRALECGKNVFCEKPLCLTEDELRQIEEVYARSAGCRLMVGFNRRFAPLTLRMKNFVSAVNGALTMIYRINAGAIAPDHWVNDPEVGGGRILGEAGHFVDLLSFLCGSAPVSVNALARSAETGQDLCATIKFQDGSMGTMIYACSGDRAFSKERIEVFGNGAAAVMDDFRRLDVVRHGKRRTVRSWLRQDKGHADEWRAFAGCVASGAPSPISFEEIVASTLTTIRITEALRSGNEQEIIPQQIAATAASLVS